MILPDEEASAVNVKSTQAVDIFAFVGAEEIPFVYFETPYYLAPAPGDEKVYALLRETLNRTRKIGIAYVVIQARKHLAALIPCGPILVLNTLRYGNEESAFGGPDFPVDELQTTNVTEQELGTATEIVESMTKKWDMSLYGDNFGLPEESDEEEFGMPTLAEILRRDVQFPEDKNLRRNRTIHQELRSSRPRTKPRRTLH